MRKLLDIIFSNKKLSICIPFIIAAIALILAIVFGNPDSIIKTILIGLLLSATWFFGVYFILLIQVKNSSCPDWFFNIFELVAVVVFGIYAIIHLIIFIISGFSSFNFGICLGMVTYSATAWAHSKRK